jgi:hypothetical protein
LKPAAARCRLRVTALQTTRHRVSTHHTHGRVGRASGVDLPVLGQSAIFNRTRGLLGPDQPKDRLTRHRGR